MGLDDKKAIFGWSMYDWANSAFATAVMAGFFPIFFEKCDKFIKVFEIRIF